MNVICDFCKKERYDLSENFYIVNIANINDMTPKKQLCLCEKCISNITKNNTQKNINKNSNENTLLLRDFLRSEIYLKNDVIFYVDDKPVNKLIKFMRFEVALVKKVEEKKYKVYLVPSDSIIGNNIEQFIEKNLIDFIKTDFYKNNKNKITFRYHINNAVVSENRLYEIRMNDPERYIIVTIKNNFNGYDISIAPKDRKEEVY